MGLSAAPCSVAEPGAEQASCIVSIPIRYIPTAYVWQTLLPTSAVSVSSLFALTLDAKSGDTAAARCSVLLVALLLLVESREDTLQAYVM